MPDPTHSAPRGRPSVVWLALPLPYSIVLAAAAVAMARRGSALTVTSRELASRLALALLTIESAVLAVAVPFLAAADAKGWRRWVMDVAAPVAVLAAASLVVMAVAARGEIPLAALVGCQVFLLSFGALLAAGVALLRSLGLRSAGAQVAAMAVGLAMVGNVFVANAAIERAPANAWRTRAIQTVLWTNPWIVAGGSILQADPCRAERLYHRSVISYYEFAYPGGNRGLAGRTAAVSIPYLLCALAAWALARTVARRRQVGRTAGSLSPDALP